MRDNSFETVLIMRLLFLPYDLVNYASGILRLRWLPFLLATALGSLPGTVSFVLLGASIDTVDDGLGGVDPAILVAASSSSWSASSSPADCAVANLSRSTRATGHQRHGKVTDMIGHDTTRTYKAASSAPGRVVSLSPSGSPVSATTSC